MQQHWVRYHHSGKVGFGTLTGQHVHEHEGDMFSSSAPTGAVWPLSQLELLTPTAPTKVIAMWNNFRALGEKLNLAVPAEPLYLLKAPNSWIAHGQDIKKPPCDGKVAFEGELGIVIGKTCTAVALEQAREHVFGYTCANDVTVSEILNRDPSFTPWDRAKGFDTFCPVGPLVANGLNWRSLELICRLNGAERQRARATDMHFSIPELVSFLSGIMTLEPGDLIATGTPAGTSPLSDGDVVEVEIPGVGILRNPVRNSETR